MAQSPRLLAGPLPSCVPFSKFQSLSVLRGPHLQMGSGSRSVVPGFRLPALPVTVVQRLTGTFAP